MFYYGLACCMLHNVDYLLYNVRVKYEIDLMKLNPKCHCPELF